MRMFSCSVASLTSRSRRMGLTTMANLLLPKVSNYLIMSHNCKRQLSNIGNKISNNNSRKIIKSEDDVVVALQAVFLNKPPLSIYSNGLNISIVNKGINKDIPHSQP